MELHENVATVKTDICWIKETLSKKIADVDANTEFRLKTKGAMALVKFLATTNVGLLLATLWQFFN